MALIHFKNGISLSVIDYNNGNSNLVALYNPGTFGFAFNTYGVILDDFDSELSGEDLLKVCDKVAKYENIEALYKDISENGVNMD